MRAHSPICAQVPALIVEGVAPLALDLGVNLTEWIGIKKYEEQDTGVNIGGKVRDSILHNVCLSLPGLLLCA